MSHDERWVLPADLVMSPLSELDHAVQASLGAEPGAVVLTRPRHRRRSVVVDADTAGLLETFRVPSTVPEAVLLHAVRRQEDPQQVLADSYPVLQQLREARYLVPLADVAATAGRPLLAPGTVLGGWRVERSLQVFDDADVYRVTGPDGPAALKVVRPGAPHRTWRALEREHEVLLLLQERDLPAPRVLGAADPPAEPPAPGEPPDPAWLALSWVEGRTVEVAAAQLRRAQGPADARGFALCAALVRAYERLHAGGVLHGDVHPANAVVQPSGEVVLLDFGLAAVTDAPPGVPRHRGGIGWAFEPELAASAVAGGGDVPVTARGEQYSLAAVCFYLLTGAHHVDLPVGRDEMFAVLVDATPRPLSEAAGVEASAVSVAEPALARALSRDPQDRHAGLADLAAALAEQAERLAADDHHRAHGSDALVARLATPRSDAAVARTPAPRSTVAHGGAGVALALLRLGELRGDPELTAAAQAWTADARLGLADDGGRLEPRLGISAGTVGPVSLFHSATGVDVADALVAYAVGDFDGAGRAVHRFLRLAGSVPDTDELVNGEAGLVVGAALLVAALRAPGVAHAGDALRVWLGPRTTALAARTTRALEATGVPLGLAHGTAGPVLAVAAAEQALAGSVDDLVGLGAQVAAPLADRLADRPVAAWAPPGLEHSWCNGSAGVALALATAGGGPDPDLLAGLADHAAAYRGANASLCCGSAGVGLSLLAVARTTGDARWRTAAREQSDLAGVHVQPAATRAHGLHKGALGAVVLADELRDPDRAAFPGLLPEPPWR